MGQKYTYRYDLKKGFLKLNLILKLCMVLLTENNIFDTNILASLNDDMTVGITFLKTCSAFTINVTGFNQQIKYNCIIRF